MNLHSRPLTQRLSKFEGWAVCGDEDDGSDALMQHPKLLFAFIFGAALFLFACALLFSGTDCESPAPQHRLPRRRLSGHV